MQLISVKSYLLSLIKQIGVETFEKQTKKLPLKDVATLISLIAFCTIFIEFFSLNKSEFLILNVVITNFFCPFNIE